MPLILLCARIHPGEVPSSYAIKGIIDFLLKLIIFFLNNKFL